jgi:hypothetical protein
VWDDFRNWITLGLEPAKADENQRQVHNGAGGSGEIEATSGAVEPEQLSGPERA